MDEWQENPYLGMRNLYMESETKRIHQQMMRWMQITLEWVEDILAAYPPSWPEPEIRRRALYMLDEPLHVRSAPIERPVAGFLNRRIERAAWEIENEAVTDGITIWKLYNHGFVVKTPDLVIGFDLYRGPFDSFHIELGLFERILQVVQALFVSHDHLDHADTYAIPRMIEMGKPVITPPWLWQDNALYPEMLRPERHWDVEHSLVLGNVPVRFRVFPGHQYPELLNNVYLVDLPCGYHIMHTGDQDVASDFDVWIDHVSERFETDVLLPNCWAADLLRFFEGVCPRLVITGHENEMAHSVAHREAYSKTYLHIAEESTPVLLVAWGEKYHYEKNDWPDKAIL